MSLSKKIVLTVSGYKISLSDSLQFYQNDQLKLIFEINKYGIDVASSFTHKTLMPLQPLTATLFIETPNGVDSIESANIIDNAVTFYLTSNQTQHIGTSTMQIKLTDDDGCQITLPSFTFEVQRNIYDGAVQVSGILLADENGNMVSDENGNAVNTTATTETSKQIKDFTLKTGVSGQEDILVQDNGVTKRIKSSELIDTVDLTGYATKTDLSNKANVSHTHTKSDITDLSIPTKTSQLTNDSGYLSSSIIKSIAVVNELPEIEIKGVLYLVVDASETPMDPEPTGTNLYPSQTTTRKSDGFTITFTGQNVTIDGQNDTESIQCQTKQFTTALAANKTYYLQFTNTSGSFDDSNRVSQSDGEICMVALTGYDSSDTPKTLIDWRERDASDIYDKFTFTPTVACTTGVLTVQAKKLTSFSNWTCSIVIAEMDPEPTGTNLYPSQETSKTSDGFVITFTGRNLTIDGSNDTSSIQCATKQFTTALAANKTYYLQFTNTSGSFDDSNRVSQSDGEICMVALTGYDSSDTPKTLIDWRERDASDIYDKFTFTPTVACTTGVLTVQAKKLTSFSNWTCSIVLAEEGV